jgi:hypothetical protein
MWPDNAAIPALFPSPLPLNMSRWKSFEVPLSQSREYWMIYRRPGFLAVVWFDSSHPLLPSPVSKLSLFLCLPLCRLSSSLTDGRREKEGLRGEPNA